MMNSREFLKQLHLEVDQHEGPNHPLLARVAHIPFRKEDYKVFGLQHYALVGHFTRYLEMLLTRSPDSRAKQWIAKVLVNEYGEGSNDLDHAALYRLFLRACGVKDGEELTTDLHPAVTGFIEEHRRICREEPFLVGLGAIGPGHEWSIPRMFQLIVRGLKRAGFTKEEILYFELHMEQDIDHGAWLEEALERYADTAESQAQIRRGAMLSLEARSRFWSGVQEKIVRWRQPKNVHFRAQGRDDGAKGAEITLATFKAKTPEWTEATR
jgi:pyrroloquinoline-quinone synthase